MGSPLAPVLCALVAAEPECLTIRSLRTVLQRQVCFAVSGMQITAAEWTNLLFRLDFYGLPIELEQVPGKNF